MARLIAEAGIYAPPVVPGRRALRRVATTTPKQVWLSRIGFQSMSDADYATSQARSAQLNSDSRRIADALERAGWPAYRSSRAVSRIDLVTLAEEELTKAFRNCNVIPAVMVANTSMMRRELLAYTAQHSVRGTMVVLGSEWCGASQLRCRVQDLNRLVSKLASHLRESCAADVIFANTEIKFKRNADGELLFHVHSHILVDHRYMPSADYRAFVYAIKARAPKNYAHTSGFNIRTTNEVVKYPFLPDKNNKLNLTDMEWRAIAESLHRQKLFRPMGGFRHWRRQFDPIHAAAFILQGCRPIILTGRQVSDRRTICRAALREARYRELLPGAAARKRFARGLISTGFQKRIVVSPARTLRSAMDPKTGATMVYADLRRHEFTARYADPLPDQERSSEDIILHIATPGPRHSARMTPSVLVLDRSRRPIADVLRWRGLTPLVDDARAIWNARAEPDAWQPIIDDVNIREGSWRVVTRNGLKYAISKEAEALNNLKQQTPPSSPVMKHTTTTTVRASSAGSSLRKPTEIGTASNDHVNSSAFTWSARKLRLASLRSVSVATDGPAHAA